MYFKSFKQLIYFYMIGAKHFFLTYCAKHIIEMCFRAFYIEDKLTFFLTNQKEIYIKKQSP
jgi:hypothetical protein